jgi:hypothetical protein
VKTSFGVSREFANEVEILTSEIVIYDESLAQIDNVFFRD